MATPDKVVCTDLCSKVASYKKVDTSLPKIQEELERQENLKKNAAAELQRSMGESKTRQGESDGEDYEYLPQLRPGPDGKINWAPLGGMTGTRPTVNKYSLERYSLEEWRKHNDGILHSDLITNANISVYNAKTAMMRAFGNVDKKQEETNKRLKQKAKDVFRWKVEVEQACKAITEEVEKLEFERQRLKGASRSLMLPESISRECLDLRSNRAVPDLVSDAAETALLTEMEMVKQVRTTFKVTLEKVEEQLKINKMAKQRVEFDLTDKSLTYDTETGNIALNNKSKTIMFRAGATKFGDFTAPLEYWEYYCRQNIIEVEEARQKSIDLRGTLEAILTGGGKKLRMLADQTDIAIAETVAIGQELCAKLENQCQDIVQNIADFENLIEELQDSIRKMDNAMKLAQTRLDNRNNWRPHGESVRDQAHVGLIDEVKTIHETVTSLYGQLSNARQVWMGLKEKRVVLEKEIASKRKTLSIDRDRIGIIRSHYPSASELAGYI